MSDVIENKSVNSTSYDEAAYLDQEGLQSIDPTLASTAPEPVSTEPDAPDRYSGGGAELTLDTKIVVKGPFGRQSLSLREILVGAGRGNEIAVQILQVIIEDKLAALADSDELNQCFAACETNVVDLLTQLEYGDETQQTEAAKAILSLLTGRDIDAFDPDLKGLKKGLLVAASIIDSEVYYEEISKLNEPELHEFRQLLRETPQVPNTPKVLKAVAQNPNFHSEEIKIAEQTQSTEVESPGDTASPAPVSGSALVGGTLSPEGSQTVASVASSSPVMSGISPASVIDQILRTHSHSSPVAKEFLSEPATQARLHARLTEIATNSSLTPAQQMQSLRLAVLANGGFRHPDFSSTEKHFIPLSATATGIANDIARSLSPDGRHGKLTATSDTNRPVLSQGGRVVQLEKGTNAEGSDTSLSETRTALRSSLVVQASKQGIAMPGLVDGAVYAASDPMALPLSTLNAAGMQGIPPSVLAMGAIIGSQGNSGSSRSSYYIDAASSVDSGDSHSDSRGGSSQQGQEGGQSQEQSSAFMA